MPILPRAVLTSRDVRASVWLVAVLRIALGLAGLLTMVLDPRALLRNIAAWTSLEVVDGRPWTFVFSVWQRWDALWYEEIARDGYHAGNNTAWIFPAVGVFLALAYPRLVIGETGSPFDLQQAWGARLAPPWQSIGDAVGHIARTGDPIEMLNLLSVVGLTAVALYGFRRLPLEYGLYALASLALLWLRDTDNLSPLMSAARYSLVIFPCFMIGAVLLRSRLGIAAGLLAISAVIQTALFVYWVHWGFVG